MEARIYNSRSMAEYKNQMRPHLKEMSGKASVKGLPDCISFYPINTLIGKSKIWNVPTINDPSISGSSVSYPEKCASSGAWRGYHIPF